MKSIFRLLSPLLAVMLLSNCLPAGFSGLPKSTETQPLLPTSILQTGTPTISITEAITITPSLTPAPFPTQTATALPSPSLEPEQARETMITQMENPWECTTPCFLGILPGQTRFSETKTILSHLGLELIGPESYNRDLLYGTSMKMDSGLFVLIELTVLDELVTDLRITIDPGEQKVGSERVWSAYSPNTMTPRFGQPSKVELFLGRAASHTQFNMVIYFDAVDAIIEYYKFDIGSNTRICPLRHEQFDDIRMWIGNNPYYPPFAGEPLEKMTGLTMETFSQLMTGNPDQACFDLQIEMFP